ncbi:HNH endonuclease [Hydrogenophaga sp. MI9]|uniref:HNH endonuclease n=1 Tax=Hydrogenophaga sp. MI9 TaxID=3453719 RepID=UPI003EEB1F51
MKQLERLLHQQGDRCFFCKGSIPPGEESVEHLNALSNDGLKDDTNCVVCCKAFNAVLGNLSIKDKFRVVLNYDGVPRCPAGKENSSEASKEASRIATTLSPELKQATDLVVDNLKRRGTDRPKRKTKLASTIKSILQGQTTVAPEDVVEQLVHQDVVVIEGTKVTYPGFADEGG